jgi:demethylmenaquinone methyltransferase/2-methoxy-6-polyprenyl-1,4-benzoquinol methylase
MTSQLPPAERFEPRAGRAMASMFDGVTGRYDLLNRLMTLGQDGHWRRAMWQSVPESARVVLDLCTGNGVSLPGLRRPGRLVLGMDVSLGMLEQAAAELDPGGWSPRLAAADAFQLPLRDGSVDAITVAFGVRNLRPRSDALREMARVLRPGGTLVVLEATGPRPGPTAPLHRLHLRRVVPLLGTLSADPSAYRYLGESILEFGDGSAFEADLAAHPFTMTRRRRFLMGATTLWTASRDDTRGKKPADRRRVLQIAGSGAGGAGENAHRESASVHERRLWAWAQLGVSAALTVALAYGLLVFFKLRDDLPLTGWQRSAAWLLLVGGTVGFLLRTLALGGELRDSARSG